MLAIEQLIKIILGVVVVAAVISALYFFGSQIGDFFRNLPGGGKELDKIFLSLLK